MSQDAPDPGRLEFTALTEQIIRPSGAPAHFAVIEPVVGRRDQWHTMTRSGRLPRLLGPYAEPFVETHPSDAKAHELAAADPAGFDYWARAGTGCGSCRPEIRKIIGESRLQKAI